jgi:CopA family copper-resistance protein
MSDPLFPRAQHALLLPRATRRRFVTGVAAGGVLAGVGMAPGFSKAQPLPATTAIQPQVLSGTDFDLHIGGLPVNLTGAARMATAVNGSVPAPVLHWREGDEVTLRVHNRLAEPTSLHWHGLLVPAAMDGVPGLSFGGIAPGESFTYRFPVRQSGTYWYHGHSRYQEQTGVYGAIVVHPRAGERHAADREHVLLLSDWSDEAPETILGHLKQQSDYYNRHRPTAADFAHDVSALGWQQAVDKRRMWNRMRMSPADLADVGGATYTYLLNGVPPGGNWTGRFGRGETLRLRIVNGSSMSIFDLRIPGLQLTVVAADGQDVEPVAVDELRIAAAETYDVLVRPRDDRAYTVFAQSIDRSGYARGTLAPRDGMAAEVPAVDPPRWLDMADMMGAMSMSDGMGSSGAAHAMPGMQGSGAQAMAGMDMVAMPHQHHPGMDMGAPTAAPAMPAMPAPSLRVFRARHARSEYGPGVDMRVDTPRGNLDDPGIGLRNNGRRVLTYADLRSIGGDPDPREPGREIELHLTGNMERYVWSFDGQKFSDARPLHFRQGERLRIVLVNDTMMPHPVHLHGMWSDVESQAGRFQVRKHTVMVQPAQRIAYRVSADAPGRWAYHCHLLFHMEMGMFREVVVS